MKTYSTDVTSLINLNLNQRIITNDNIQYRVFHYDKELLSYNNTRLRDYRHVTFTYPENNVISFASPQTSSYSKFKQSNPNFNNLIVNEYIEGDNICLFYDYRICKWKLTTINSHNENSNNDTIVTRFISSLGYVDIAHINDMMCINELYKNCCFLFVIKHNDATNISTSYLVSVYRMCNQYVEFIPSSTYENWDTLKEYNGIICFPIRYDMNNYEDTERLLLSFTSETSGVMLTDSATGDTCKLLSFYYSTKTKLHNINSIVIFRYLCLRRINGVHKYLSQSTKDKNNFYRIRDVYEELINMLYNAYMETYVRKNNLRLCEKYFTFIRKIHQDVYISSFAKQKKQCVTRKEVVNYLNSLHPKEVLSIMIGNEN